MKKKLFIGFDTSNYTTSLAICDEDCKVIANLKYLLPVAEGQRGLRQSDAVFAHIKNLPLIAADLRGVLADLKEDYEFVAGGVSITPRSIEGSYMPCFLCGKAVAETVCSVLNIPLFETSHQVGHVVAASASALSSSKITPKDFFANSLIALHVSGGTTDLLLVKPDADKIISIEQIGGSADANAGQIIDRTGLRLGFKFPCGPALDVSAMEYKEKIKGIKTSVKGLNFNLSGLENIAEKMIANKCSVSETSAYVLEYISKSIEKCLLNAFERYGKLPVVFAGGVMSSQYIKQRLSKYGMFSEGQYSADNASGVAIVTNLMYNNDMFKENTFDSECGG